MRLNHHHYKMLDPSQDILGKIPLSPRRNSNEPSKYNIGIFRDGFETYESVPQKLGCQELRRWQACLRSHGIDGREMLPSQMYSGF